MDSTKPKVKKPRCYFCKKKLKSLSTWSCECGFKFCTSCRMPEKHKCTFDFSKKQKEQLKSKLIKVEHTKIATI